MHYYKLIYDYENDDKYINCNIGNIGDIDEYATSKGAKINAWEDVTFQYNSTEGDVLSDYISNVYRWLIVSGRFKELTEKLLCNQVQYLPVKLIDFVSKKVTNSFYVANIISVVDALDLENSKYDIFELDDEKIISVQKYAIKRSKIKENHIFRLKDNTIPIFVSEKIKNIIEENGLSGFDFLEVDVI